MAILKFKPIKLNDKGAAVKEAAKLLAKAGSSIKPTEEFNVGMRSAVCAFQKKNGLPVTGIIDKKTWDKLQAYKAPRKGLKK